MSGQDTDEQCQADAQQDDPQEKTENGLRGNRAGVGRGVRLDRGVRGLHGREQVGQDDEDHGCQYSHNQDGVHGDLAFLINEDAPGLGLHPAFTHVMGVLDGRREDLHPFLDRQGFADIDR